MIQLFPYFARNFEKRPNGIVFPVLTLFHFRMPCKSSSDKTTDLWISPSLTSRNATNNYDIIQFG